MNISHKRKSLVAGLSFMFIIALILFTNPDNLPLPMLLLPFVLLFVAVYVTINLVLERYFDNLGGRARNGLTLFLTALPILLLILQSIGQLSFRDILITLGLIGAIGFYFRKTDFLK